MAVRVELHMWLSATTCERWMQEFLGGVQGHPLLQKNFTLDNSNHVLSMLQVGKKTGYCSQEKKNLFHSNRVIFTDQSLFQNDKISLAALELSPKV